MSENGPREFLRRELHHYWRLDLASFCLLVVLTLLLRAVMFQSTVGGVVVTLLVEPLAPALLLGLRFVFPRLLLDFSFAVRPVLLTALLFVAAAFVLTAWAKVATELTGWSVVRWMDLENWVLPWAYYTITFVSWGLARFWLTAEIATRREQQRAIAAEAEALKAELHHLRHQLDPHFLFNALNGIASEIPVRPQAATDMVHELADYLRYSLDQRNLTVSPFVSEIDAMRSYLDVQKARFGPDLRYCLKADDAARAQKTPGFLLQPLVENALKHGFKTGAVPLDIAIGATCDGASLDITVAGTGTLRPDWKTAGNPGVGLSVLRRRLELHYPDRYHFDMRQTDDRVTATLRLRGQPCFV